MRFPNRHAMFAALFVSLWLSGPPDAAWAAPPAPPPKAGPETLIVGSETDFPPYAIVDAQGRADGFSVELFKAVAEAMGLRASFRAGEWSAVWEALKQGQVDALPLVARTPGREAQAELTHPHTTAYDSFFVRKGSTPPKSLAEAEGKEIIVMRGDAAEDELRRRGFRGRLIQTANSSEAMRLLASGRHDAVLASKLIGHMVLNETGLDRLIQSGPPLPDYQRDFAFAVRKGNGALKDRLEQGVAIVKATGRYDEIYEKWLGALKPPTIDFAALAWWVAAPTGAALFLAAWAFSLHREICLRVEHEQALRESKARLRAILETAADAIIVTDEQGVVQSVNPATEHIFGYTPGEIVGQNVSMLVPESHRAGHDGHVRELAKAAGSGAVKSFGREVEGRRKDGSIFPVDLNIAGWTVGGKRYFTGVVRDATERHNREEQVRLLLHEVNHRAKNLLGVVQAIASQTASSRRDDFMARFSERIQALAANQDLLVKSEWKGVELGELARSQLAHFAGLIGKRIVIAGPPLRVAPEAAQPIAMAMHELATNAGKYGALSNDAGKVEIAWGVSGEGGDQRFHMSWTESGGPAVTPPSQRGFGGTVTVYIPERQLDAEVSLAFPADGVIWRLTCPVRNVLEPSVGQGAPSPCAPSLDQWDHMQSSR